MCYCVHSSTSTRFQVRPSTLPIDNSTGNVAALAFMEQLIQSKIQRLFCTVTFTLFLLSLLLWFLCHFFNATSLEFLCSTCSYSSSSVAENLACFQKSPLCFFSSVLCFCGLVSVLIQPYNFSCAHYSLMEPQMDEERDLALTRMRKSVEKPGSSAEVTNLLVSCVMYLQCVPS